MNDSNFNALIRLLDDEDPEVSTHVWGKLSELGKEEGLDRFEAAWEVEGDPSIQKRIEELIQSITLSDVATELLEWRKDGGKNLLEGWFFITRTLYPELELQPLKNEINRLVNKTWLEINDRMRPEQKLRTLNHILFKREGYGPDDDDGRHPQLNYLNTLLAQKKGNVMTLALLYLVICQKLDFPVHGVLLPGYFLLLYRDGVREFYIDVYNGGKFFTKEDLKRYMKRVGVEEKPSYFKPTSHIYIILTLIQMMIIDYRNIEREDKVMELESLLDEIEIRFE